MILVPENTPTKNTEEINHCFKKLKLDSIARNSMVCSFGKSFNQNQNPLEELKNLYPIISDEILTDALNKFNNNFVQANSYLLGTQIEPIEKVKFSYNKFSNNFSNDLQNSNLNSSKFNNNEFLKLNDNKKKTNRRFASDLLTESISNNSKLSNVDNNNNINFNSNLTNNNNAMIVDVDYNNISNENIILIPKTNNSDNINITHHSITNQHNLSNTNTANKTSEFEFTFFNKQSIKEFTISTIENIKEISSKLSLLLNSSTEFSKEFKSLTNELINSNFLI